MAIPQAAYQNHTSSDSLDVSTSDKAGRWAGVAGLAGALLFFTGDMLFYGHLGPGSTFTSGALAMRKRSGASCLPLSSS